MRNPYCSISPWAEAQFLCLKIHFYSMCVEPQTDRVDRLVIYWWYKLWKISFTLCSLALVHVHFSTLIKEMIMETVIFKPFGIPDTVYITLSLFTCKPRQKQMVRKTICSRFVWAVWDQPVSNSFTTGIFKRCHSVIQVSLEHVTIVLHVILSTF